MEQETTCMEYHGGPFDGRLEFWDGYPYHDQLRMSDGSIYRIAMTGQRQFRADWVERPCEPQS